MPAVHTISAALLASLVKAEPGHGKVYGFHMMSQGHPPVSEAGFSWYQRVTSLLQYDPEDEGVFTSSFGSGGAWFSRQNASDPPDVCPCLNFACCGKNKPNEQDKCGWLFESFEGGSVVGIGKLMGRTVKWQPGDSVGCYRAYTQSPLFHTGRLQPHDCSWDDASTVSSGRPSSMGLAQLSNRLLLLPDGMTFAEEGMFGNANVKTPFGKTSEKDDRNSWTIVFDATNFAGPVAYFMPEFWKLRGKGRENETASFKDYSNVPAIGMSSPGWEVLNLEDYVDENVTKLPKMAFPQHKGRTALWMASRAHSNSDILEPLELALATGVLDPSQLLAKGAPPESCSHSSAAKFGKTATIGTLDNSFDENGDCVWSLKVENASCSAEEPLCNAPQYYDQKGSIIDQSRASAALRAQRFPTKTNQGSRPAYDALSKGSYKPVGGCLDSPGPAVATLYCAKTVDATWVGYRWYRFVDQPGLQQAKLSKAERSFMQSRVEKLHKMMPTPISRWVHGSKAAEEGLATLDPAALVTPPKGLQNGYVPIVLYQGDVKPSGCHSETATV